MFFLRIPMARGQRKLCVHMTGYGKNVVLSARANSSARDHFDVLAVPC